MRVIGILKKDTNADLKLDGSSMFTICHFRNIPEIDKSLFQEFELVYVSVYIAGHLAYKLKKIVECKNCLQIFTQQELNYLIPKRIWNLLMKLIEVS